MARRGRSSRESAVPPPELPAEQPPAPPPPVPQVDANEARFARMERHLELLTPCSHDNIEVRFRDWHQMHKLHR